jgi:hypothetical protein
MSAPISGAILLRKHIPGLYWVAEIMLWIYRFYLRQFQYVSIALLLLDPPDVASEITPL